MPLIPYPHVLALPGVPVIPRSASVAPTMAIELSNVNATLPTPAAEPVWGIFDSNGNALYTPSSTGTISTFSVGFTRTMNISDFPIEANVTGKLGAAFASFNKVFQPANPIVTIAVAGADFDLSGFLTAIDAACKSTGLYSVFTPDAVYVDYSIESYSYQRTAQRGATMLMVEISLKEILPIYPSYSNPSPIKNPQSQSAASQINSGSIQSSAPSSQALSTLRSDSHDIVGIH